MNKEKIYNDLKSVLTNSEIKIDEPLKNYSFTKTGGNADIFTMPSVFEDVQAIVKYALEHSIPYTILGNGSNLIIRDGGIRGIVILLTKLKSISLVDNRIIVQSGATIIDTSEYALKNLLTGLEFACGIPGTVGGAVYMNAGAYEGQVADIIVDVLVLNNEGEMIRLSKDELELDYRSSSISKRKDIVLEATFELKQGNYQEIKDEMERLTELRRAKQPLEYPSCGSVFKRPKNNYAGTLIQNSGLKGKRIGGAQVSEKHAGFIVNIDNATASDYLNLIELIQTSVKSKFDVDLETEVKIIGED